jgi:hypothetical protein
MNISLLTNSTTITQTLGFPNYAFNGWFYAILMFSLVVILFVWFTQLQFGTIRALLFAFLVTTLPAIFLRLIEAHNYPFIGDEYLIFHIFMVIILSILEKANQSK